ncbi:hypothetical protein HanPI659440_Chr03g0097741 [Helianthus annuus]|nr:hypothetical protein HanPI659440_Chr03g0097741 [Helianthus annuus]
MVTRGKVLMFLICLPSLFFFVVLFLMVFFTIGYCLLNVLDPKTSGAMIEAMLAEGRPVWLDQIRDRFLHPTSDSFATYANATLGDEDVDDLNDTVDPTREEKLDKSEKKEEKAEEDVAGAPRDKRVERDPDDDETLTEIMKKKKIIEDKKKELDEQDAAALVAKRSKLQKETPPAPSELEIDLGVFSEKRGNLLEKIFEASGVKSGKAPHKVDTSKIPPPTSPPSRTFGLSPPHVDRGKGKEDDVEIEQVGEGGGDASGAGDVGGGDTGRGDDVIEESSEATPHHTVYTKVVWDSGRGGASRTHHSPEYEHAQGGSWDTHNPACVDLPHVPRWNLTQGSRMAELANCREFFSLPPMLRDYFKKDVTGWTSWMISSILGSTFSLPPKRSPGSGS